MNNADLVASQAFFASLVTYSLVRFLPIWGLALIGATVAYMGPLVYMNNKVIIDEKIDAIQEIVNAQTVHVKEMAETQTAHATDAVRHYVNDYRTKAHDYVAIRSRQASPETEKVPSNVGQMHTIKAEETGTLQPEIVPEAVEIDNTVQQTEFPTAPLTEPFLDSASAAQALAEARNEMVHTPEIAV